MLSYSDAEALLARLHAVPEEARAGVFRARLKHFRKLGVPLDSNPGKGQKITYGREPLFQWAFCLKLAAFGFDPSLIAKTLNAHWQKTILPAYIRATQEDDRFIYLAPDILKSSWSGGDPIASIGDTSIKDVDFLLENFAFATTDQLCLFNISDAAQEIAANCPQG